MEKKKTQDHRPVDQAYIPFTFFSSGSERTQHPRGTGAPHAPDRGLVHTFLTSDARRTPPILALEEQEQEGVSQQPHPPTHTHTPPRPQGHKKGKMIIHENRSMHLRTWTYYMHACTWALTSATERYGSNRRMISGRALWKCSTACPETVLALGSAPLGHSQPTSPRDWRKTREKHEQPTAVEKTSLRDLFEFAPNCLYARRRRWRRDTSHTPAIAPLEKRKQNFP